MREGMGMMSAARERYGGAAERAEEQDVRPSLSELNTSSSAGDRRAFAKRFATYIGETDNATIEAITAMLPRYVESVETYDVTPDQATSNLEKTVRKGLERRSDKGYAKAA